MAAVLLLIIPAVLLLLCWLYPKWRFRSLSHIPGPRALPIFGNGLEFGHNTVEKLNDLTRIVDTYGNLVQLFFGVTSCNIVISDPEATEFFISSTKYIKKSTDYDHLRPWIQNGLLTSTGSYWQKRRKTITPTFHFKILENFIPVFCDAAKILINKLSKEIDKEIDIYPFITAYTLDVICDTAMGTNVKAQENPNNEYVNAVKSVCNIVINRVFSIWKQYDFLYKFSNDYKEQEKCLKILHGFTDSVIEKKRQELVAKERNKDTANANEDEDVGMKKRMAFLDMLLTATIDGTPLTNSDVREEVDTFMFEGHDTTASAIAFCLYELSKNPKVQEKLVNEIEKTFGANMDRELTIQELNNMKYLELVIKETLRLYPSVPMYSRELTEEAVFKGTVYPKGTTIIFFDYYMHRRPDLFPNAESFHPERFLPENNNGSRNPFTYIPFSAGPRNCIGQKFAMYEIKTTIAKIVNSFEILPALITPDLILSAEIVLKSMNGVNMRLKPRKF